MGGAECVGEVVQGRRVRIVSVSFAWKLRLWSDDSLMTAMNKCHYTKGFGDL